MGELSPSDAIALAGGRNGNDGWGDGNGWWIILLFMIFGWGGNRGWNNGGGAGGVGGNELYPWLNNSDQINSGFQNQMINTGINGIQQSITNGFADTQQALCAGFGGVNMGISNGFAQAEISANSRQMANMNQLFGAQTAMMQGFDGMQAQLANCCCENRLATANQTAALLAEHCTDRQALSDGIRDIIAKLDSQDLYAERRENENLRQQLAMAQLAASQTAQTAQLIADNAAQTAILRAAATPATASTGA